MKNKICTLMLPIAAIPLYIWVYRNPEVVSLLLFAFCLVGFACWFAVNLCSALSSRHLTPLLLGLALAWWLGKGPKDGGDSD